MKLIEKNIEWIVVISVVLISTITVLDRIMSIFFPQGKVFLNYVQLFFVVLLLAYQIKYYGIRFFNRLFVTFFSLYSLYILAYLTVFQHYKLEQMHAVPPSVTYFVYITILTFTYLLCSETIVNKININKFFFLSVFLCVFPSLIYIFYLGMDTIQAYGIEGDEANVIGRLTLSYSNMPLLIIACVKYNNICKSRWFSIAFSSLIIFAIAYILIVSTKRGPLLWSAVGLVICSFIVSRKKIRYIVIILSIVLFLFANIDFILDQIKSIAPMTAERISTAIYEGDTAHRFDTTDKSGSAYIIGLRQFQESPIFGSYFRLISNDSFFMGHYPHNIFIEILITMGFFGFIPFVYLLISGIKNMCLFSKYTDTELIVLILFVSEFLKLLTTGTILMLTEFWLFFYIMCSLSMIRKKRIVKFMGNVTK